MKKCPSCKSVYTDDTLAFCLSDGTPLTTGSVAGQTILLPDLNKTDSDLIHPTVDSTRPPKSVETLFSAKPIEPKRPNSILIYAIVGLFFFLIGGGVFLFIFRNQIFDSQSANPTVSPTNPIEAAITPKPPETPPSTPKPTTYRVIGVASKDFLFIRPEPGNLKSWIGKIPPNAAGLIITGSGVKSSQAIWYPVDYNGTKGWINGKFIAKE